MYQKVAPMFLVENVEETITWYRSILGAKLQHSLPNTPPFEWVSLLLNKIEIMFAQKQAAQILFHKINLKKMMMNKEDDCLKIERK